jgi:HSP20 family molecular chaperone IbpA
MAKEVKTVGSSDVAERIGQQQVAPTLESGERASTRPTFAPRTDIYETRNHIVVLAEMPGIAPDGVDITLERGVLTIHGRSSDQSRGGYRQVYAEFADGDYERVFTLSEDIERERIEATHKDGVLHLVLPKAEGAKARKIPLKST